MNLHFANLKSAVCRLAIAVALWRGVTLPAASILIANQDAPVTVQGGNLPPALAWLNVKYPGNLPCAVWQNLAPQTNKTASLFSAFNWPSNIVRDTNCLIYPATGATAFIPTYGPNSQGYWGVPAVLITRRVALIRGHGTGQVSGQIATDASQQFYFWDRQNNPYFVTSYKRLGRLSDTNFPGWDYLLISFTSDVPTNIEVMPQIYVADYNHKYAAPWWSVQPYCQPILGTIYPAGVNLGYYQAVPGFSALNVGSPWAGGTSGSPDMILIPTATGETLAMYQGRSTSGIGGQYNSATAPSQMLADLYTLEEASGCDTNNPDYQPVMVDLSGYPNL